MRRAIEAHLGTEQVGRVIYGAIIGLALVLVMEQHPPSAGVVAGSLIASGVAVGLAELYAEVVGTETRTRHRVRREHMAEIADDVVAVFFGISFPAVFFFLAAAGVMELHTAFGWAKWSGLGLIGFYGYAAARLAGAGPVTCVIQAVSAALIGGALIAVKAVLH
jgi:VIT1/CCC1 family predicted Fe2+/Mn2+ transporter